MAVTYGEQMLRHAESEARSDAARRRKLLLLYPSVAAILWALSDLVAARITRLAEAGIGGLGVLVDLFVPIVWTVGLVLLPLMASIRTPGLPSGGVLAFLAGPLMSTMLFGPGGWKWWQLLIVSAASLMVFTAGSGPARE